MTKVSDKALIWQQLEPLVKAVLLQLIHQSDHHGNKTRPRWWPQPKWTPKLPHSSSSMLKPSTLWDFISTNSSRYSNNFRWGKANSSSQLEPTVPTWATYRSEASLIPSILPCCRLSSCNSIQMVEFQIWECCHFRMALYSRDSTWTILISKLHRQRKQQPKYRAMLGCKAGFQMVSTHKLCSKCSWRGKISKELCPRAKCSQELHKLHELKKTRPWSTTWTPKSAYLTKMCAKLSKNLSKRRKKCVASESKCLIWISVSSKATSHSCNMKNTIKS